MSNHILATITNVITEDEALKEKVGTMQKLTVHSVHMEKYEFGGKDTYDAVTDKATIEKADYYCFVFTVNFFGHSLRFKSDYMTEYEFYNIDEHTISNVGAAVRYLEKLVRPEYENARTPLMLDCCENDGNRFGLELFDRQLNGLTFQAIQYPSDNHEVIIFTCGKYIYKFTGGYGTTSGYSSRVHQCDIDGEVINYTSLGGGTYVDAKCFVRHFPNHFFPTKLN